MQSHELGIYTFKDRQKRNVSECCFVVYWFDISSSSENLEKKQDVVNRTQGPPGDNS